MTTSASRFQFPVIDFRTVDFTKPVQDVTARLQQLGSAMLEQPFGKQPAVFLADTALIDEVNDETAWEKHVGPSLGRLREVTGDGLFTAHGHEPNWAKAHNILAPLFTKAAMKRYHDSMLAPIRELVEAWDKKSKVRSWIPIPIEANRLTLEIIGRAGMGYSFSDLSSPRQPEHPFVGVVTRELAYADRHTADISEDRKSKHTADIAEARRHSVAVVESRRRESGTGEDMLDAMLHNTDPDTGEQLDAGNILHQIRTFLIVGSETSANAIAFALHFLSVNPDVAARARAEIDQCWPDRGFPDVAFDEVGKLRYLRCVVDETLRLWPAAPGYFRQARQDTTIGGGKHAFRAGEWVFVHLIAAHRSTAWGADADEFNPDRFLPENLRQLPARTYRPFGTGARACLGRQFALHEILLTLTAVLHQYDLEPLPGYCLTASEAMTLKPVGLQVRLHRR